MTGEPVNPKTARLASIAVRFDDPDLDPAAIVPTREVGDGVWTMPYVEYAPIVDDLIKISYEDGWVRQDFDWSGWMGTDEAQSFMSDPETIELATTAQVASLLTAILRQDRFVEGTILGAIESGLLQRILKRIRSLHCAATGHYR